MDGRPVNLTRVPETNLTISGKPADSSVELHPLITQRWSPRALDSDAKVTDEQLHALIEAARWAPSCGNTQPARYIVGRRGDVTFNRIHEILNEGNQSWAYAAAALLLGVAITRNAKGEVPYAEYGLALATENLVLQAVAEGLVAHQMAGFDQEGASATFALPAEARPLIVIAVGRLGDPAQLVEYQRERELAPRTRLDLSEIAYTEQWGRSAF